jgi:hypothetical protein
MYLTDVRHGARSRPAVDERIAANGRRRGRHRRASTRLGAAVWLAEAPRAPVLCVRPGLWFTNPLGTARDLARRNAFPVRARLGQAPFSPARGVIQHPQALLMRQKADG